MKHCFLKGITAVSTAALLIGMSQPSQAAFPGRTFGCSNPGPGLEVFPGSANALIATPDGVTSGFPVQSNIAVFGDVPQANGILATGETRCFQAMKVLNQLNTPSRVGTMTITYQPLTNGHKVTGATICMVPLAAAGIRNCGVDGSYNLFTISQSSTPIRTAANIAEKLGSMSLYVGGSSISKTQIDGHSWI
jgi:hypothetical protein